MVFTHSFNSFFPIAPPRGALGTTMAILQLVVTVSCYFDERTKPTQYSKFASMKDDLMKNPIPSRLGMLIIYGPSSVVGALILMCELLPPTPVGPLVFLHFFKRALETLFLHKYSGKMEQECAVAIGILYVTYAIMVPNYALPEEALDEQWKTVGYVIFLAGTLGNLYHHYLLTTFRRTNIKSSSSASVSQKSRYPAPVGGLFSLVAAPHYLCELIAWFGIACVAQQANAFLVLSAMSSYLLARAKNTNDYYFEQFDKEEWPLSRKALIPFLV